MNTNQFLALQFGDHVIWTKEDEDQEHGVVFSAPVDKVVVGWENGSRTTFTVHRDRSLYRWLERDFRMVPPVMLGAAVEPAALAPPAETGLEFLFGDFVEYNGELGVVTRVRTMSDRDLANVLVVFMNTEISEQWFGYGCVNLLSALRHQPRHVIRDGALLVAVADGLIDISQIAVMRWREETPRGYWAVWLVGSDAVIALDEQEAALVLEAWKARKGVLPPTRKSPATASGKSENLRHIGSAAPIEAATSRAS